MMRSSRLGVVVVFCAAGCSPAAEDDGFVSNPSSPDTGGESDSGEAFVDERPVVTAGAVPPPISGGTLLLIDDGKTAVAADPDRDLVHVTPLDRDDRFRSVALEKGDEPGRVVADDAGLVHVVLRGAGAIATIDPVDVSLVARHETCANPRGIAFDAGREQLLVACAGGELVAHEVGGPIRERRFVEPDLRDVFVRDDGTVQVSRFRTAELLTLADDGTIAERVRPTMLDRMASTAWRTRPFAGDRWVMVHHASSSAPLDLDPPAGDSYSGPNHSGCDAAVASTVSLRLPDGSVGTSGLLASATLPVDVAVSPDGERWAIAVAGQSDAGAPRPQTIAAVYMLPPSVPPEDDAPCTVPDVAPIPGQAIAVEFVDDDTIVAQLREPAGLRIWSVNDANVYAIDFSVRPRYDTGHELFHQDAGGGMSCASCHPEGGDDGRTWRFAPGDLRRRTQSLRVSLAGTEPFHWSGDMDDFTMIAEEVLAHRMGAPRPSDARIEAFRDWVFAIRPSNPEPGDATLAARGLEVFVESGCATCHNEGALSGGMHTEMPDGPMQVPSLAGLALRPPYMHDGRALDLPSAVQDMLESTQPDLELPPEDLDALVVYLGSL